MQKQIKILLTLLITLALLVSCSNKNITSPNTAPNDSWVNDPNLDKLKIQWVQSENTLYTTNFTITTNNYFIKTRMKYIKDTTTLIYSLNIKYISWTSDTSGIIYGQYVYHKEDKSVIGKWYAVAFRNLSRTSIEISEANKEIGTNPDTNFPIYDYSAETLEEAISKFTEANGYFYDYRNHQNKLSLIPVTSGKYAVQYGIRIRVLDTSDKRELSRLWRSFINSQYLYTRNDYRTAIGYFDFSTGHCFEDNSKQNIKREFIKSGVYEYNNKKLLVGIYWDDNPIPFNSDNYRLLMIDENGAMRDWYGGGKDRTVEPDENTVWTNANRIFGYLIYYR